MTERLYEDWSNKIAEKIFAMITNRKRDTLYSLAKTDPILKKHLDSIEKSVEDMHTYYDKMLKMRKI